MRDFLVNFFRDDVGGPAILMYNWVHILYLLLIVGGIVLEYFLFRNKDEKTKKLVLQIHAIIVIGLYLSDFLVHPFMNNEDYLMVDKLPYHICTVSSLLIAIVNVFPNRTKHVKTAFTLFGLIGAFYYVFIPSGVTGPDVMAFRYRTIQTFIYHGVLLGYGVLSILFNDIEINIKKVWVEAVCLVALILISLGANNAYAIPELGVHYDWFFTTGSSFGFSPKIMPFIIFGVFFGTVLVIYGIVYLVKYLLNKKKA